MPEAQDVDPRSVAVIGGGIAGITAAIKLNKQGYRVTLFEKANELGGNLSSNSEDQEGRPFEVYPHIFGDWYEEFWSLLQDIGLKRDDLFLRRDDVRMAIISGENHAPEKFEDVTFATVSTPTTLRNLLNNCYNGVLTPRESLLFGYTYLDMVSAQTTSERQSKLLTDLDVTGFLYSRPYMNNEIADFHDDILRIIWSVPSDSVSLKAYRKLIKHTLTFPLDTPFAWLSKGPLKTKLLDKIEAELKARISKKGGKIRKGWKVTSVALDDRMDANQNPRDAFVAIGSKDPKGRDRLDTFRYAVIATPAREAGYLSLGDGSRTSLIYRQPNLARLREAQTARIPVVYLYFTPEFLRDHREDLKFLPNELTGFKQRKSKSGAKPVAGAEDPTAGAAKLAVLFPNIPLPEVGYDISIHNIASVWDDPRNDLGAERGEPVLVVAASRATAIKAIGPEEVGNTTYGAEDDSGRRQGWQMLVRLHGYLPFINPGKEWGASDPDARGPVSVDYSRTRVITNKEHQLFLNDTGSNEWRPKVKLENAKGELVCRNVFFAGDYCMTDVDMATVEAAVQSGVLAAQALQWENRAETPIPEGKAIRLRKHTVYSAEALLVAKLFTSPAAYLAALTDLYQGAEQKPSEAVRFPLMAATLAAAFWTDWLRSINQLAGHLIPDSDERNEGPPGYSGRHDRKIGVIGLAANVARALIVEGPRVAPKLQEEGMELAYGAWRGTIGRALFPRMRRTWRDPDRPHAAIPPRRRQGAPSTWADLVDDALGDTQDTAGRLSNVAFGKTAGALAFLQGLPSVQANKPRKLRRLLRHGIEQGAAAYRRREDAD